MSSDALHQLRDACLSGDAEAARKAIDAGADLAPNGGGWNKNFPFLATAARNGHEEVVQLLVSKGATLPTEDAWRILVGDGEKRIAWGPILRSIDFKGSLAPTNQAWGLFFAKICHQAPPFIDEINRHCQDPGAVWSTFGSGGTPLTAFLRTGKARHLVDKILPYLDKVDAEAICEAAKGDETTLPAMLAKGGNPNARSAQEKNTALHLAAEYDSLDAIKTLVAAGASLEARNNNGNTPLMLCSSLEAVRLMADLGANLAASNASGVPALNMLIQGAVQRLGNLGQNNASEHLSELLKVYKDHAQDLLRRSSAGETVMHALAEVVRTRSEVEALIESTGVPELIDQPDLQGITPLMKCIEKAGEYKGFIELGANLDAVDFEGRSALMQSVKNKFSHAVVLLLSAGAKTDIVDDHGKTALDLAIESADLKTISALKAVGAESVFYADLAPASASAGIHQRLKHGPLTAAMSTGNIKLMMHVCSRLESDPAYELDQKDVKRALAIDAKDPAECGAFLKSWMARQTIRNVMRRPASAALET